MSSPITFHSAALTPILAGLKNIHVVLTKGATHIESLSHDAADYTSARLAPDMLNLAEQVYRLTDSAKAIPPRVNPENKALTLPDVETTFPELLERIENTIAYLESIDAKTFEGREGEDVILLLAKGAVRVEFKALEYVQIYAQPNFWFHVVTAYDILRMKGVPLGKMDFLNGTGAIKVVMGEYEE